SPTKLAFVEAFSRARSNQHYASHDEQQQGARAGFKFNDPFGAIQEVSYTLTKREVSSLASDASATIRASANDTVLSALQHIYTLDTRDFPMLASRGSLFRATSTLAGILTGVSHFKYEIDTQHSHTVGPAGFPITFTGSLRAGILHQLAPSLLN